MASKRPGIRTGVLNQGYNSVGRPTAPANNRGPAVQQISPTLATQKDRTQVLATGKRGAAKQNQANIGTAAAAAGTVITQGAMQLAETAGNVAESFAEAVKRLVPDNVPLVEIPGITGPITDILGINTPVADVRGINAPIVDNPIQIVGATIQTSQYSPELVQEAKVRAQKGDVVSGLYAATAESPFVRGTRELYERVSGPGYTPTSKALAGGAMALGGVVASVPAALQAVNFLNNPNRMAYTGELPKSVSGVEIAGSRPTIGGTVTMTTEEIEVADAVLGSVATSAKDLAKQEIPRFIDAVATEFRENPYGLTGQLLTGAALTKGVGSVLPKRIPSMKIQGEATTKKPGQTNVKQTHPTKEDATPWVNADYTMKAAGRGGGGGALPNRVQRVRGGDFSAGFVVQNGAVQKTAAAAGLGAALLAGSESASPVSLPQQVRTVTNYEIVTGLPTQKGVGEIVTGLPTQKGVGEIVTGLPTQKGVGEIVTGLPTQKGVGEIVTGLPTQSGYGDSAYSLPKSVDVVKESELYSEGYSARLNNKNDAVNQVKYEVIPRRVEVNELNNQLKYDFNYRNADLNAEENANKKRVVNNNKEEGATRTRTHNRVQEEYVYDFSVPRLTRTNRDKRKTRIDIDIDLSKTPKRKKKAKPKKQYSKRQIVNPLPWLWDEEPQFGRKIPQEVTQVSAQNLLA